MLTSHKWLWYLIKAEALLFIKPVSSREKKTFIMAVWEGLAISSRSFQASAHVFTETHVSNNLSLDSLTSPQYLLSTWGLAVWLEWSFFLRKYQTISPVSDGWLNWTSSLFGCLAEATITFIFYIIFKFSTYNVVTMAKTVVTMVIFCTIRDSRTVQ